MIEATTHKLPIGSKVPLLFTYRDVLFGNGFVVEVIAANGRALCVHESDGFWMYGINPGGMSAMGENPSAAHAAFRCTFSSILKNLTREARDLKEFTHSVECFFSETNEGYEPDWQAAVQAVRNNEVRAEGIPKAPADSQRSIRVELKEAFSAEDNQAVLEPQLAA